MYFELYDVFLFFGIACLAIAGFVAAALVLPNKQNRDYPLFNKRYRDALIKDYKDPEIVAGGFLGIIKYLLIIGICATIVGACVRIVKIWW